MGALAVQAETHALMCECGACVEDFIGCVHLALIKKMEAILKNYMYMLVELLYYTGRLKWIQWMRS